MGLLNFSLRHDTPVIVQTEAAECGLACLAMLAAHHGHRIDLPTLRSRHAVSLKGSTLGDLMRVAGALDLAPRPLRLDLDHLAQLQLPCALHWDFNHFVVLVRIDGGQLLVHDPAVGRRVLTLPEFSRHFTGVALEARPTPAFQPRIERQRVRLAALVGGLPGLGGALGQVLLLASVLQVLAIAGPFHMQWVVDQALVAHDRDLVAVLGVGFLLLALLQTGVTALRSWLLIVLGTQLNLQLMTRLLRHLLRLPMAWFEKRHVGDVMSRFESLGVLQRTLTTSFLEALLDGVMALATLAMMLVYSAQLAAVAVTAAILYTLLRVSLYAPVRLATEEQIVRGARQHSHLLESVRGMQSLKLLGREEQRGATWQNLVVDEFNAGIRAKRLALIYQTGQGALFGIETAVTLWLGALLVLDVAQGSAFSVGMLYAFVSYKSQFMQRTAALVENLLQLRMLGLHTDRVGDIAMAPAEQATGTGPIDAALGDVGLELKSVSFRHGENEPWVLQDFDLRVQEGESVAIVGPSGCGKTTLVKLMLGLLQPSTGHIEIGGRPLAHVGLATWRGAVACVMQDDQLFAGSIGENISFFEPAPDHAHIEACARLAAVHEDIAAMPMQYNTLVGDMGTVLSGGQKQRILLARALYRRPRVLVLDEATSHLDIARERSVNEAVRGLRLTRIIVAHRPETIASADRVVLLAPGSAQAMRVAPGRHRHALADADAVPHTAPGHSPVALGF